MIDRKRRLSVYLFVVLALEVVLVAGRVEASHPIRAFLITFCSGFGLMSWCRLALNAERRAVMLQYEAALQEALAKGRLN